MCLMKNVRCNRAGLIALANRPSEVPTKEAPDAKDYFYFEFPSRKVQDVLKGRVSDRIYVNFFAGTLIGEYT